MDHDLPPLDAVLGKLPWYQSLTSEHRREMMDDVAERLSTETSREQYAALLERWAETAHSDVKWSRFELLRESGLLAS